LVTILIFRFYFFFFFFKKKSENFFKKIGFAPYKKRVPKYPPPHQTKAQETQENDNQILSVFKRSLGNR